MSAVDPMPWVHVNGARVANPAASTSPQGGYTFCPRREFGDYPDRYISTRFPEGAYCETHGRHHGVCGKVRGGGRGD